MKIKHINFGKNSLLKKIICIGVLMSALLIIFIWSKLNSRYPSINLEKYRYERELENSHCISPDGNFALKVLTVYDHPIGGQGYILGFVYNKISNEKKWVYLQKCVVSTRPEISGFSVSGGDIYWKDNNTYWRDNNVYWKDNNIVVIGTHEIDIQDENTYYFKKEN